MLPRFLCVLALTAALAPGALAQQSRDPLRFVPAEAEWVACVDSPRTVFETVEKNALFQQAKKLVGVRDFYDSTNFHRLYQLVAYFEKELGKSRNELLDDLGGGGLVFAVRFSAPKGVLVVLQPKDEKQLRRFVDLGLDIVGKELERQESKDRIVRSKYRRYETFQIGTKANFAIADGALLFADEMPFLKTVLDGRRKKAASTNILQVSNFVAARKQSPKGALAWTWFHLEAIRKIPDFKSGLDAASLDPAQTLLFGGIVNQLTRTPYVSAALTRDGDSYRLGVSMPCGRTGMSAISHMILPPGDQGILPPLMPPRTVASSSYFIDLGQYWDKRHDILGEKNAKGLEEAEGNIAKLLGGIKLGKLLQSAGPHQRLVFAQQKESPYKIKPAQSFPAFALVVDMRDPSFAKNMNTILRSGALLATFKVGLNLKEETYKGCDMVSYYFSETKKVDEDPDGARFLFSPTYVTVGDQFIMSATAELARDLVDVLKDGPSQTPIKATERTEILASGLADLTRANQDTVLTGLLLAQHISPKIAREEMQQLIAWLERLGTLRMEMEYRTNDFRFDVVLQPKK